MSKIHHNWIFPPPPAEEEPEKDDWDADSGDDWDADSADSDGMFGDLDKKLQILDIESDDEEDLVEKEKAAEKERLRKLGLERQKRDRIKAEKAAEFQAEQQEMEFRRRWRHRRGRRGERGARRRRKLIWKRGIGII